MRASIKDARNSGDRQKSGGMENETVIFPASQLKTVRVQAACYQLYKFG
ncbi:MAG: hypothetical protein ICV86_12900 [Microcoleus sp. T3-bin5]|nr:hypothetical protein [Microcoleus sp. T3-bin5]